MMNAVCFLASLAISLAAPSEDLIGRLPGLRERVPFKQYSGYLTVSPGRYLHYWFVESQSSPQDDPLVLWLNGGPGCSSVVGLLDELGPFKIDPDGRTVITNYEYSWNKVANVLFLESPPGVGFSYSEVKNYTTNDDQTREDNYMALRHFFKLYPEYRSNDLYLTGESYAGIYIPMLAAKVVDDHEMNFQGMAIGNGALDGINSINALVYFSYYHGLIGNVMWDKMKKLCCDGKSVYRCDFVQGALRNPRCLKQVYEIYLISWRRGLNPYNLYAPCDGGVPEEDGLIQAFSTSEHKVYSHNFMKIMLDAAFQQCHDSSSGRFQNQANTVGRTSLYLPCTNSSAMETYLNSRPVRRVLNIREDSPYWTSCGPAVEDTYKSQFKPDGVRDEVLKVIRKGHRVLIYNGDADMACNFLGNEWFVEDLNLKPVSEYQPWYSVNEKGERQVSGFYKQYRNLDLVTIKGSGHFVPKDKPQQALEMFERFLRSEGY